MKVVVFAFRSPVCWVGTKSVYVTVSLFEPPSPQAAGSIISTREMTQILEGFWFSFAGLSVLVDLKTNRSNSFLGGFERETVAGRVPKYTQNPLE